MRSTRRAHNWWLLLSVCIACVVAVPVLAVLSSIGADTGGVWRHLATTRLPDYLSNTLLLTAGVCTLTAILGIPAAWLIAMYDFPGRRVLSWGLLLPLAVPAYLSAYALTDLLQFSGPVQSVLRDATGLGAGEYWFPEVRSLPGAIVILGFSLYPYVYFAARAAFREQSQGLLDAARTLGCGPLRTALRIGLPLARPALVGSLALVMMETVADFGAVEHCAVDTLATGIYRTWLGLESLDAAAQLSSVTLTIVVVLLATEMFTRRKARYHRSAARHVAPKRVRLSRVPGLLAAAACVFPLTIGLLLPVGRFAYLATIAGDARATELFGTLMRNTLLLGVIAALSAVALALCVTYTARLKKGRFAAGVREVCRAGYALPGPVIAIGLLSALGWLDHRLNEFQGWVAPDAAQLGLVLSGSIVAVLIGYQTRFLAVAVTTMQGAFERSPARIDDAARSLGAGPWRTLLTVHLPMMRLSLLTAGILVFVDVIKELPATLMLRPFNFDTLAVRVYQLASDERLPEASTGALAIIALGLVPVYLLHKLLDPESARRRTA
jgi:iron(III) transport system permease protein